MTQGSAKKAKTAPKPVIVKKRTVSLERRARIVCLKDR